MLQVTFKGCSSLDVLKLEKLENTACECCECHIRLFKQSTNRASLGNTLHSVIYALVFHYLPPAAFKEDEDGEYSVYKGGEQDRVAQENCARELQNIENCIDEVVKRQDWLRSS